MILCSNVKLGGLSIIEIIDQLLDIVVLLYDPIHILEEADEVVVVLLFCNIGRQLALCFVILL